MSTTANENLFTIIDGPNRDTLIDAFKYAYDKDIGNKLCRFTIGDATQKKTVSARIIEIRRVDEIAHEDGSGYSFMFKCYYSEGAGKNAIRATGYYHARTRQGWLRPDVE